jgi:alpha-ribazole phosphatase
MEIYLVRHTTPAIAKGVCYGQADIDITSSFLSEAGIIQNHLPQNIAAIYSSPLQRCKKLADHLFPQQPIQFQENLKEINCGHWELQKWDDIPKEEIDPWLKDPINTSIPGGESYMDVLQRTIQCFQFIHQQAKPAAVIAHGGVIRSILSYITTTALIDSFKVFTLFYGCVIKIETISGKHRHSILSNIPHEKETHKPSYL